MARGTGKFGEKRATFTLPVCGDSVFAAVFTAVAVTAAQDVFEITVGTAKTVKIREIRLGQYSDFGDAAAEILSVQIIKGYTVSGSGGSAATPTDLSSAAATAVSAVEVNNTTVANTGTALTLVSTGWNVQTEWVYKPADANERIELSAGQRLVVRITAPADSLTMNGTLIFDESAA